YFKYRLSIFYPPENEVFLRKRSVFEKTKTKTKTKYFLRSDLGLINEVFLKNEVFLRSDFVLIVIREMTLFNFQNENEVFLRKRKRKRS
ncbi:hypothetical protein L9F63_023778, partial [Diploptera punctata]